MNLPNADKARVDRAKITEYLLAADHPDGGSKAEFFRRFGFRMQEWEILAEALRRHGAKHPVAKSVESVYGVRYAVEGELEAADGRAPRVRSVWMTGRGSIVPRLITAHPC